MEGVSKGKKFLLSAVLLGFLLPIMAQQDGQAGELEAKQSETLGDYLEGYFTVPEDHRSLVGPTLKLHLKLLLSEERLAQAAAADSRADAKKVVVVLWGAQAISEKAAFFAEYLPELRKTHDVLLLDQRGSWNSNPLATNLPRYANSIYTYTNEKQFAQQTGLAIRAVQAKGRPELYTSTQVAKDLEFVRQKLRYEKLDLWASGEGCLLANRYAQTYPDHVRSVVLHSPAPQSHWASAQQKARTSLDQVFAECFADSACQAAYPQLTERFGLLYQRLAKFPEYTDLQLEDGSMTKIGIDATVLEQILLDQMRTTTTRALIPWLVDRAHQGDMSVLAERADIDERAVPLGTHLCRVCNEDPSFKDPRTIVYDENTPFGPNRYKREVKLCRAWPKSEQPTAPLAAFSAPALLLQGTLDHSSEAEELTDYQKRATRQTTIALKGRAQQDLDFCTLELISAFFQKGNGKGLDQSCAQERLVVPFYVP